MGTELGGLLQPTLVGVERNDRGARGRPQDLHGQVPQAPDADHDDGGAGGDPRRDSEIAW